jgi:DNA-binding MarR family transcriptional regulator
VKPLSDRQYRSLARFRHRLRVFLRFSELSAREVGLTPAQHGDLAEVLQSRPHSTLELARRAEEAGLVSLAADPADRRRQLVSLTEEGREKLAALSVLHREELRRVRHELREILDDLG